MSATNEETSSAPLALQGGQASPLRENMVANDGTTPVIGDVTVEKPQAYGPEIAHPVHTGRKHVSTTSRKLAEISMQTDDVAEQVSPVASQPVQQVRRGGISPENTVFVSLSFEGPDVYSSAGGLGTRVTELTESLAGLGYETHLIFVGDPNKPSNERRVNGKLHLQRWGQWISKYYPNGVYDGEEHKLYDYNESVPQSVYTEIALPAIAQEKMIVIIGEDWHTSEVVCRISDLLHWHNLRHRSVLMWNCNSLMSLHRINWGRLNYCSTITTVSRYMKHRLWEYGVNPLAIP
ncbi:MAG: hypothetical protein ACLQUY_02770, partial [Ktedonobacterales bacterium]